MQEFPISNAEARTLKGKYPDGRAKIVGSRGMFFVEVTEEVFAGRGPVRIKAERKFVRGRPLRRANR